MALRNYKPKTDTIQAGDEEVTIRALTLSDVTILVDAHWSEMKAIYDFYAGTEAEASIDEKVNRAILECVRVAPDLAAAMIAVSAGEPDAVEIAKSLPFTVQVDAVLKIVTMTLSEAGGLGNFLAVLQRAMDSVKTALPAMSAPPSVVPDPLASMN